MPVGERITPEDVKYSQRLAFDIRDSLAFSKSELGFCELEMLELQWRDPKQQPIA